MKKSSVNYRGERNKQQQQTKPAGGEGRGKELTTLLSVAVNIHYCTEYIQEVTSLRCSAMANGNGNGNASLCDVVRCGVVW